MNVRMISFLNFLVFASPAALAAADLSDLRETFTPMTTGGQESRWVTIEYQLVLPLREEEHLLAHYIEMWGNRYIGKPENYEQLRRHFAGILPKNKGYPLVERDGDLNPVSIGYWIAWHQRFTGILASRGLFKRSTILGIVIDEDKTVVDEERQRLHLVYQVKRELQLSDEDSSLDDYDLTEYLPTSLHDHFYHVLGADALKEQAIDYLAARELPKSYLRWKRALTSVKHPCLGEEAISGMLTMNQFLRHYKPSDTSCYLPADYFAQGLLRESEDPVPDVKTYPEYNELFKDGKLSILVAIQQCNDRRYLCRESALGYPLQTNRFLAELADYGFQAVDEGPNIKRYQRQVGGLAVELTLLIQPRPVYYEVSFWQLFPHADIVVANRIPFMQEHLKRLYVPRYQIVLHESAQQLAWGRILPRLDYELLNLDALAVPVDRLPPTRLLDFLEEVIQTEGYHDRPREEWERDTDWRFLIGGLEKDRHGPDDPSSPVPVVAHFARGNRFQPGSGATPIDFDSRPEVSDYVRLLDTRRIDDWNYVNHRLTYLYLTLHVGEQEESFSDFRDTLQDICRNQLANRWASHYFFARDCSPASLLASDGFPLDGTSFARGSYVELYYGRAGRPKAAYLADTTTIGSFAFKSYFQDNGGVVRFYRNGQLKQGHLAAPIDYLGLPLLGGNGTSMVRFYENGALQSAQLREDVQYPIGERVLNLRGGWRGPHKVTFYPAGGPECAYLAEDTVVDGLVLTSVPANTAGTSDKVVCFHANGRLKSGVLAKETRIHDVPYPAGTKVILNRRGEVIGPLYQTVGREEYYWDALFPEGSLYIVDPETSEPKWIRLEGDLRLRNHSLPAGTEIFFTSRGTFLRVVAPSNARPHIVFYNYSIAVPENATLVFHSWSGEPRALIFDTPITIGDLTYLPAPTMGWRDGASLILHGNGRVSKGVLGIDAHVREPHYGAIAVRGGEPISFNERGEVREATLVDDYTFVYESNAGEGPPQHVHDVHLPAGSAFSLGYDGRLREARVGASWRYGDVILPAQGRVHFDGGHNVRTIDFPAAGGQVGAFRVAEGRVDFFERGQARTILLAQPARVGGMLLPAGAMVSFFSSGGVSEISAYHAPWLVFEVGGLGFARSISFFRNGRVKAGYLSENIVYSGVEIAGVEHCHRIRLYGPEMRAESCQVSFYEDGTSLLRGIAAQTFETDGSVIMAGQPVEFDEYGELFHDPS